MESPDLGGFRFRWLDYDVLPGGNWVMIRSFLEIEDGMNYTVDHINDCRSTLCAVLAAGCQAQRRRSCDMRRQ